MSAQNTLNIGILKAKNAINGNYLNLNESNFSDLLSFPTGNWAFNFDGGQFKIPAFHGSLIKDSLLKYEKDIKVAKLDTISGRHAIKNIAPRYYILNEDLSKFRNNFNFRVLSNFQSLVKDISFYKKCKNNQFNYKKFKENMN